MISPFAALGLEPTASTDEVKAAFRSKARSLHPDVGGDPNEFDALQTAYKDALRVTTSRKCTTCQGTRRVTKTMGWSSLKIPCPDCG